ncbi:hypothetical protein [Phenylobacterium sp.]|uniref:hypothetical protein n=1 Tax=Phenylobacterium sp. TaxID=1871053 RepID=UPI0035AF9170
MALPVGPVHRSELEHTVAMCLAKHWQAHIRCLSCDRKVVWRAAELARLPGRLTLNALARAACCNACGGVGADIALTQDHDATRAADMARIAAKAAANPPWTPPKPAG